MEKENIDKKQKNYWFGVSAFLFLIIMILSIVMGIVGLDINKDNDGTQIPVTPEETKKEGNYGYLSYYDNDGVYTNGNKETRSLFKTIDLMEVDLNIPFSENDLKVQTVPLSQETEEQLIDVGIVEEINEDGINTTKNGWNWTKLSFNDDGTEIIGDPIDVDEEIENYFSEHNKEITFGYEDGYINSAEGDHLTNLSLAGDGFAEFGDNLKKGFVGFYVDVIDPDDHWSALDPHNGILLIIIDKNAEPLNSVPASKFGAKITATMIFDGDLEGTWKEIKEANGNLDDVYLWESQKTQLISFYVDNNGQAELYDEAGEVIIAGDFDFVGKTDLGGLVVEILNKEESTEISSLIREYVNSEDFKVSLKDAAVFLHSLLDVHTKVGFKQDSFDNTQEESMLEQDYIIDLNLGFGLKVKKHNNNFGLIIDFDAKVYDVPSLPTFA